MKEESKIEKKAEKDTSVESVETTKENPEVILEGLKQEVIETYKQLDKLPPFDSSKFSTKEFYDQIKEIENSSDYLQAGAHGGHYEFSEENSKKTLGLLKNIKDVDSKVNDLKLQY